MVNFCLVNSADIKQSPNNKVIDVLELGTIPIGSASFTFGSIRGISLAFIKMLSFSDAIPITLIPNLFAYFNKLVNSDVLPE